MILKETLKEIAKSQRKSFDASELGVRREYISGIDLRLPYAFIISGIRRCGKSTVLRQLSEKLLGFYYLNFEDPRLATFELSDFEKLDEIFHEEFGSQEFYLFDEVQNIEKWEVFVRSRLDKKKRFIITGSNASFLSKELGTRLTGRHINIELFPFSYNEALKFNGAKADIKTFDKYAKGGGFPEYLKYENQDILRELFVDVIQRDIVARYKIREAKALNEMALYLLANIGNELSYNKLKDTFALGSVNTISSFISYLEDSYLIFTVPRFDYSLKKQTVNPKKIYTIDSGFSSANSVSFSQDKGKMLENIAFLALRRHNKQIFYFRSEKDYECDFLVKRGTDIKMALQVCYELNEQNKERELRGLAEALKKFGLADGLILTFNQEDKMIYEGKKIMAIPLWKWIESEDAEKETGAFKRSKNAAR